MTNPTKIFLISPPRVGLLEGFTSGLVSIADYVKQRVEGCDIEVLDWGNENADKPDFKLLRAEDKTTVFVGITTTTATYSSAIRLAKAIKKKMPKYKVILGGHHASPEYKNILQNHPDCVDYVIIGEGEKAMESLINGYPLLEKVPNLAYLEKGQIKRNPPSQLLDQEELDSLSTSLTTEGDFQTKGKFDSVTYVSARGCPLSCHFCAVANQKIRVKSPEKVSMDIKKLVAAGATHITIEDNFFAHNRSRTLEVCDALTELRNSGVVFTWDCQTRVESVIREDVLTAMENAGCREIYVGLEAFGEDGIIFLGKTANAKVYFDRFWNKMLDNVLTSRIDLNVNLQIGLPIDTDSSIETRLVNLERLGRKAIQYGETITIFPMLFVVYPGTRHFNDLVAKNEVQHDVFETFVSWEDTNQPIKSWLGKTFAHGIGGIPLGLMDLDKLKSNEFCIEEKKVKRVKTELATWQQIPGVNIFEYGQHLAI